jgi:putative ABC transport system substrate-binding protein
MRETTTLAQQATMPVVGLIHPLSPDTYADSLRAFHSGLKDSGYVEGENVTIVYRWAGGQTDQLRAMAAELVRRHVSVIAAFSPAAFATKAATTQVPIVFLVNVDPVRLGLRYQFCHW